MTGTKAQVGCMLYQLGVVKFGAFRLKLHDEHPDAPLSPIYLSLRNDKHPTNPGPMTQEAMRATAELMSQEVKDLEFDHFVGIPEAGEPFADELERIFSTLPNPPSRLWLHKEQLDDGTRRIRNVVDGEFQPFDTVLVIDDLITQAHSKLEAIEALENQGLNVTHVLVLVDRQQGGKEQLEAEEYKLLSVFTLDGLLSLYVDEWFISSDEADAVRNYVRGNRV